MRKTIDNYDELMARAKRYAKRKGQPLRAIVEEGLRRILVEPARKVHYKLPDRSIGDLDMADPLDAWSWQDLRDEIYGGPRP